MEQTENQCFRCGKVFQVEFSLRGEVEILVRCQECGATDWVARPSVIEEIANAKLKAERIGKCPHGCKWMKSEEYWEPPEHANEDDVLCPIHWPDGGWGPPPFDRHSMSGAKRTAEQDALWLEARPDHVPQSIKDILRYAEEGR